MPPPRLELRPRQQAAGALDRVVDARGQHVVRIRINTRRTQWKSKRMDVNANASHAANILLSLTLFSFFPLFYLRQGVFLPPRFWVFTCTIHPSHTQGTQGKRPHERNYCCCFFVHSVPPFLLSFLHVMTSPTQRTTCTHISHRIVFPQ
jgi:hypothetical protein